MSIIIIAFPGAPKVDLEAQKKDEALNKLLQQKVAGELQILPKVINASLFIVEKSNPFVKYCCEDNKKGSAH